MPAAPALTTKKASSRLTSLAWYVFKLSFGLLSLAATWASVAWENGVSPPRDTDEEKQELEHAQQQYWSLDREPLPGFRHAFFTTSTGVNIHYVVNASADATTPRNVAIFVHGFPDSWMLWRYVLETPALWRAHTLVAVDLPGYGGSDGLPKYGPVEVLETMAEFVLGMRQQFLSEGGKCVVVGHDWGALVCARLASEAGELAEHWVITSGIIPQATASNAVARWTLARQMLRTWTRHPFNTSLLKNALHTLKPVLSQFRRSFYIFCFHLPAPLACFFASFGNFWFLRATHRLGLGAHKTHNNLPDPQAAAESMCMSTGPALPQFLHHPVGAPRYGESVRRRIPDRGMPEKMRIYREALFLGRWTKSLSLTAALFALRSGADRPASSAPEGAFTAPATLVLGERDPAFDLRLALDNVSEYLVRGSAVVVVREAGHWLPLEPTARVVLGQVVLWALSGEAGGGRATPFEGMIDVEVVEEV